MAVSTGIMMAISAAASIAGQLKQGQANRAAGDAEAQQLERRAAQERDAALQEADKIRRDAKRTQGAARAQLAASGVNVNSGTALTIDDEISADSERDAHMTLLTGKRRSDASTFAASQSRARGSNAMKASVLGSISTGLQAWKGVKQAEPEYRYQVPDYPGAEY